MSGQFILTIHQIVYSINVIQDVFLCGLFCKLGPGHLHSFLELFPQQTLCHSQSKGHLLWLYADIVSLPLPPTRQQLLKGLVHFSKCLGILHKISQKSSKCPFETWHVFPNVLLMCSFLFWDLAPKYYSLITIGHCTRCLSGGREEMCEVLLQIKHRQGSDIKVTWHHL